MARLRYNGLTASLGGSGLTTSATAVTFGAALTYNGAAATAVPTISSPDYIPLTILDSSGNVSEIVWLTAYTSGATTGTISRAQEGTTGVAHNSGDRVVHGPTTLDFVPGLTLLKQVVLGSAAASIGFTSSDIPTSGFSHLRVVLQGRTTVAAANDTVNTSFNGDTADANYATKFFYGTTGTGYDTSVARNSSFLAGSQATANRPGIVTMEIPDYLGTTWHKLAHMSFYSPGSPVLGLGELAWANTAAITAINLAPQSGANFTAGTKAWLYGLP